MEIKIDKSSKTPFYKQIYRKIVKFIDDETLQQGDKLVAERELAAQLGIARGTIKKAYHELEHSGYLKTITGKGSFVKTPKPCKKAGSRMDKAVTIVSHALNELDYLNFSLGEISNIFYLMVREREKNLATLHIAAVDCNIESLAIFEKQILYVSRINIAKYLLSEVRKLSEPAAVFADFDLILITTTHYQDFLELIPDCKDRLLQVAVSPSEKTITALAAIKKQAHIGILCQSKQFYRIIMQRLADFDFQDSQILTNVMPPCFCPQEILQLDTLIVPPDFRISSYQEYLPFVTEFALRGGQLIHFEYRIQRGSLIHIEEKITSLLDRKG